MKTHLTFISFFIYVLGVSQNYPIIDTDIIEFYNNNSIIAPPNIGQSFYGQDAQYTFNQPSYTNNADGTITDNITGLMWEQDMGEKISYDSAFHKAANSSLGGYNDWRVPTIKELYSLSNFTGRCFGDNSVLMFIDTNFFYQPIGDTSIGEREIDGQTWSSTQYVGLIMTGDTAVFGFNFVDGRLKGYPKHKQQTGLPNKMYFRLVRGNPLYGINDYIDNGNGTITDIATGLMWQQSDDGITRNWEDALLYCENLTFAGHDDWRLPNAKELQSIVDYNRSPYHTNSPAIDSLFFCTSFINPEGNSNYGYYWTSTTLQDGPFPYSDAVYLSFGDAQGQMSFPPANTPMIYDTHGAGSQRNDPKRIGNNTYPDFFGPQGDIRYVNNYVRAVRNVSSSTSIDKNQTTELKLYPNPVKNKLTVYSSNVLNEIYITNTIGELMLVHFSNSKKATIDVDRLTPGLYFISTSTNNSFKKIIISN